jgi:hypothetical protein
MAAAAPKNNSAKEFENATKTEAELEEEQRIEDLKN